MGCQVRRESANTCLVIEQLQDRDTAACRGSEYQISIALPVCSKGRDKEREGGRKEIRRGRAVIRAGREVGMDGKDKGREGGRRGEVRQYGGVGAYNAGDSVCYDHGTKRKQNRK